MSANFAKLISFGKLNYGTHHMAIYDAQVNRKGTRCEPEVGRKWNARDLQAQRACALQFLYDKIQIIFFKKYEVQIFACKVVIIILVVYLVQIVIGINSRISTKNIY